MANLQHSYMKTKTWLNYELCLDGNYFRDTKPGQAYKNDSDNAVAHKSLEPPAAEDSGTESKIGVETSHPVNPARTSSLLARRYLSNIGLSVLRGDGRANRKATNRGQSAVRRLAEEPISVSQILRELRSIVAKQGNDGKQSIPKSEKTNLRKDDRIWPQRILDVLEHDDFRPDVGEIGLSFIEQGLLEPEDWTLCLDTVADKIFNEELNKSMLNDESDFMTLHASRPETAITSHKAASAAADTFLTRNPNIRGSTPFGNLLPSKNSSSEESGTCLPSLDTGGSKVSDVKEFQEEEEKVRSRLLDIENRRKQDFGIGHGGGPPRLFDIFGKRRPKPIKIGLVQPSAAKREKNRNYAIMDFPVRRTVRTCSTAVPDLLLSKDGPLGPVAAGFSLSDLSQMKLGDHLSQLEHLKELAKTREEIDGTRHEDRSSNPNKRSHLLNSISRSVPTLPLSPFALSAHGMFHSKNELRQSRQGLRALPKMRDEDGVLATDSHGQAKGGIETTLKGDMHKQILTSNATCVSSTPALWWAHSLEVKPSNIDFGKVLLGTSAQVQVRLQCVGINTVRFRIYAAHESLNASNTSPPGPLAPGMKSIFVASLCPTSAGLFESEIQIVSHDEVIYVNVTANVLDKWVED